MKIGCFLAQRWPNGEHVGLPLDLASFLGIVVVVSEEPFFWQYRLLRPFVTELVKENMFACIWRNRDPSKRSKLSDSIAFRRRTSFNRPKKCQSFHILSFSLVICFLPDICSQRSVGQYFRINCTTIAKHLDFGENFLLFVL